MALKRYLNDREFCKAIDSLHAYSGPASDSLLDLLEEQRLLEPRLRVELPHSVERRIWLALRYDEELEMDEEVEADGSEMSRAHELLTALDHWRNPSRYGQIAHPLEGDSRFKCYITKPHESGFTRRRDRRIDVSNSTHRPLFAPPSVGALYSSWQILIAIEVESAGIHFRVNLEDKASRTTVCSALENDRAPSHTWTCLTEHIHAIRAFRAHADILDMVVWHSEECDRALAQLIANGPSGRFQLSREQSTKYTDTKRTLAQEALARWTPDDEHLIALCKYLAERWEYWQSRERPSFSRHYKHILWASVEVLRLGTSMPLDDVIAKIGPVDGDRVPILDRIWPNWIEDQKQRTIRTLTHAVTAEPYQHITQSCLADFADFIAINGHEAFFWRVDSFHTHAFSSKSHALAGMKADLQGLALCVEHILESLGASGSQLYEKFKSLWRQHPVGTILRDGKVGPLAWKSDLANDWSGLIQRIDSLRVDTAGNIAADLVFAHRIRGGVHYDLPESDAFEIERQFVTIMRAAVLCFARSKGVETTPTFSSNAAE